MELKFGGNKIAYFVPFFDVYSFDNLDFTVNFWIKLYSVDKKRNILACPDPEKDLVLSLFIVIEYLFSIF